MFVFRTIAGLQNYLDSQKASTIGFTPTMGALHEGHLSLLHRSKKDTQLSVVSIFVNPTQFNDPADLARYPRTLDRDLDLLYEAGCDVAFVPEVEEIYPVDMPSEKIDLNGLDMGMEGYFRPGHFAGVAQVVKRLLELVKPHYLFMGQKDFQQVAVVSHMIKSVGIPVQLIMCPTIREANGLAMSSRNVRLSPEMRERASVIYRALKYCVGHIDDMSIDDLKEAALINLDVDGFRAEYFEIIDGKTLHPANENTQYVVACCAVWADDVRLIDNMVLKTDSEKVREVRK